MLRFIVSIFAVLALPSQVLSEGFAQHDEVIVETSRPQLLDIDPSAHSGLVTVVSKDEFTSDALSVADIVERQVGVQVRELGGHGSFSSVSIRGSSSKHVNGYLDGVLLNGSYHGAVDLSQFLLGGVEQVEIYRGNAPIYLEQTGIGGAINIKTSAKADKSGGQVRASIGSEGLKRAAATYRGRIGDTNYLLSAETLNADNDYTITNQMNTPDKHFDDVEQAKNNNDVEQRSLLASFNKNLGEAFRLSLTGQFSEKKQGVPEIQNIEANHSLFEDEFLSLQSSLAHYFQPNLEINYTLFGLYKETVFTDEQSVVGLNPNDDRTVAASLGANVRVQLSHGAHLSSALLSVKTEDYKLEQRILGNSSNYQRITSVLGLQDEWVTDSGEWVLSGGARFLSAFNEFEQKDDTQFYHDVQFGLLSQLNASVQFSANVSQNIRLPELSEMYGDRGFTLGNEDLKEEEALNADVSIRYDSNPIKGILALFYRHLDDAILTIYNSRGIGKAQNISKAQIQGLELTNELSLGQYFTINTNLTFQDTENRSNSRAFKGNSLPGVYDFSGNIALSVEDSERSIGLEYMRQEGGVYDTAGVASLPDLKQVNVNLGFKHQTGAFEFKVKNVSDQRVSKYNRFPGPGRQWFVSYSHQF